jgi:hypothetical protein
MPGTHQEYEKSHRVRMPQTQQHILRLRRPELGGLSGYFLCVAICRLSLFVEN